MKEVFKGIIHPIHIFVKEFCMKYFIFILAILCVGCTQSGYDVKSFDSGVEFYEYPNNTLVFECMTMVFLNQDTVYTSKFIVPTGTTIRFKMRDADWLGEIYAEFIDTNDVDYISKHEIVIKGDDTVKEAFLKTTVPPRTCYFCIETYYNGDFELIDYEISK